jgi:probable O-glycosylation ligase (exosortase A-associated)
MLSTASNVIEQKNGYWKKPTPSTPVPSQARDGFWFLLVVAYLFIEYVRPMDYFGFLKLIRPGMMVDILLIISWVTLKDLNLLHLFKNSGQTEFVWAFILLLACYIPFATNNYWAYIYTLSVLKYMPFFLSAILFINSFDRLRRFFDIWVLLSVYLAIMGILGKGIGGSDFLGDENDFSLLMNMMLPFGFFLFMYERNNFKKILYLGSSLLEVISVVASSSRGGFVGLVAVFTVLWLLSPRKIASLLLVGVLVGVLYYSANEKYWDRMSTIQNTQEGTAKLRIDSWKAAWEMFKDKPLGVGGGNFPVQFPEYQGEAFSRGMYGREAHSLWFTLLSELGIIGVIIYTVLLFYNLKDLFQMKRLKNEVDDDLRFAAYLSMAFMASFIGYFASGTFLSVLYYPHYFYFTALIVATKHLVDQRLAIKI